MLKRCESAVLAATFLASGAAATAVAQEARLTDTRREARNRTLITDAFTRWSAGTGDVFSLLADDVVWHITGLDPSVAQTYNSRQALLDAAASPLRARLGKPLKPSVRRVWADGDDVLVHWDGAAPFKDGSQYRNTYLWIMTVRGQKIVAVTAFLDNAAFAAALANQRRRYEVLAPGLPPARPASILSGKKRSNVGAGRRLQRTRSLACEPANA